jgi:hypothetical protein
MRSFDITEDLAFEVCGEKFTMKNVRPEVLALWEDEDAKDAPSGQRAVEVTDQRILAFLDNGNGQHERWKALREREQNALSIGQLGGILEWMIEVQTARPTKQPSPSPRGRGASAPTSAAE